MFRAVAIAVGVALAVPSAASADTTREAFDAAIEDMSAERFAEAAKKLVALADADPKHRLADDALFAAGQLYEERLADPKRALAIYRRLVKNYPDSRESLAAKRRAEALERNMGAGGEGADALAAYTRVLQRFHLRSEAKSVARMEAVVKKYPNWRGLPRAMVWLGQLHERRGRLSEAQRWYVAGIEAAKRLPRGADRDDHLFHAYRGAGEVAYRLGNYDAARSYYERMPVAGDPSKREAVKQLMADLDKRVRRQRYYVVAIVVLLVLLGAGVVSLRLAYSSWGEALRGLARPPGEVVFMVPVALVLTLGAFTGHHGTAKAVAMISFGGVVVAWLNGAGLSGRKASGLRVGVHVVGSVVAVVCVCYVALHATNLIDQMMRVLKLGPDVS